MSETVNKFDPGAFGPDLACDPFTQIPRIFVYFLSSLFRHEEFRGTGLWWNKDPNVTEILISAEKPRLEALEKRPHITVIQGASQWANLGMDQMQRRKMASEERVHTDMLASTVTYHCQGKEGLHCRRIAWYASQYTNVFRRMLMRYGKLHHVAPNHQISAESGPTAFLGKLASEELVSVVVSIPFYWQPQWLIIEPRELLKKVTSTLNVRPWRAKPLTVKGKPAYSIPIGQYQSFDELAEAANPTPSFSQTVENTED